MTFSLLRVSTFIQKYSRDVEHDSSRILKSICKKSADCYVIYELRGFLFIGNICEMAKADEIDTKL